jgi:hypothetical protein
MSRKRKMSGSSIGTWNTCRRRWFFQEKGILPVAQSRALSFGELFHYGVALYRRSREEGLLPMHESVNGAVNAMLLYAAQKAADLQASGLPGGDEGAAKVTDTANEVAVVLRNYFLNYSQDALVPILVEASFELKLPHSRTKFCGRIDEIARLGDEYYIVERKTTGARRACDYMAEVRFAAQPIDYVWAGRQLGYPVRGVIYDVVRSKVPSRPKILKDGSISASACDTTLEIFESTLRENSLQRGDYLETLAALERDKKDGVWFYRSVWGVTDAEIEEALEDKVQIAKSYGKAPYTRNVGACNVQSRKCPYQSLCARAHESDWQNFPVEFLGQLGYRRVAKEEGTPIELQKTNEDVGF